MPKTQQPGDAYRGPRAGPDGGPAAPGAEAGFCDATRRSLDELASSELGGVVLGRKLLSDVGLWVTFVAREPTGERVLLNIRPREALDEETTQAVLRAADVNRDAHHPSVLSVRRFGRTADLLWVTTLGFTGRLLVPSSSALRKDRVAHAMEFLRQVAGPLDSVHAAGLVHGALSRASFHLDSDGYVRLRNVEIDTPILRAGLAAGSETQAGACASPEVRAGRDPGPDSDQYALAALLVHALTGSYPGPKGELPERDIPDGMRASLARALHTDRKQRHASVLAMWEVLDAEGFSLREPIGGDQDAVDPPPDPDAVYDPHVTPDPEGAGYVPSAFRPRNERRPRPGPAGYPRERRPAAGYPDAPWPRSGAAGHPHDPTAAAREPLRFPEPWERDGDRDGSPVWSRALSAALVLLLLSGSVELFFSDARPPDGPPDAAVSESVMAGAERASPGALRDELAPGDASGGSTEDPVGGTIDDSSATSAPADTSSEEPAAPEPATASEVDDEPTAARPPPARGAAATPPARDPSPVETTPSRTTARPIPAPSAGVAPREPYVAGALSLQTYPWGAVYVDGAFVGNSPLLNVPIAPGPHTIRVERRGYEAYVRELNVQPGQALRLTGIVLTQGGS